MPWVRIDENALSHGKILALSHGAFRLWVEGLAYCQKHLSDGHIPAVALRTFRYLSQVRLGELTAANGPYRPLWDSYEQDGYWVHDYLQWNDSREKVEVERAKSRERYGRWKGKRNGVANAVSDGVATGVHVHNTITTQKSMDTTPARCAHKGPRLLVWHWQHEDLGRRLGAKVETFDLLGWYGRLEAELERTGEAISDPWKWLQYRLYTDAKLPPPNLMRGPQDEPKAGAAYKPYVPLAQREAKP